MHFARGLLVLPLLACPAVALAGANQYLWVPNGAEGTVSKLDAATGKELARYASISSTTLQVNHVNRALQAWGAAHKPEYVGVDFHGNAWVANVAPGIQPSVTKFWADEADCVDWNGNGKIDTSREVNLTPGIQLDDPDEFLAQSDECIAMTVVLGDSSGEARGLAIDRGLDAASGGNAWIGMRYEQAYYQIDGATGALMQRVPPAGPSGRAVFTAAIDGDGILWVNGECCVAPKLWRIDTETGAHSLITIPGLTCSGSFDIAIDLAGKVWLAGHPCSSAIRYDPSTSTWAEARVSNGWSALGIGLDRRGNVWLSLHLLSGPNDGRLARVDTTSVLDTGEWDNKGDFPFAVAVGFDGDVWSINRGTDDVSRLHIDSVTHEPAPHPTTGNVVDVFPVGDLSEAHGDFTGLALHTIVRPTVAEPIFADGFESGSTSAWSGVDP